MTRASEPAYELYAIRYANESRKLFENFIWPIREPRDLHDTEMPLDYYIWVIQSAERTIVVDTGFDQVEGARRGRDIMVPIERSLAILGIQPDQVTDVILSHMHWDHAGNHDLFPHARYHVQEREIHYCTGICMCHAPLRRGFAIQDVTAVLHRLYEGRVQFHDGNSTMLPGISLHWVGGHTRGLQVVRVHTRRGWVVLASDASHLYVNLDEGRLFPSILDANEMFSAYRTISQLAASPDHWIPGHDPLVLELYPPFHPEAPHIVRLDVDPLRDRR